jgi:hypothetical protein
VGVFGLFLGYVLMIYNPLKHLRSSTPSEVSQFNCCMCCFSVGSDSFMTDHTSGQLGLGGEARPHALSEGGEPQLQLYSSPRRVGEDGLGEGRVEQIATGLDHCVILLRKPDGGQEILTCGINTDGQLGDASVQMCSPSLIHLKGDLFEPPLPSSSDDPIAGVAAGGDSSILWTASGRVWAWGNSEYGQCLVGGEAINQIRTPREATHDIKKSIKEKIVDIRFGGSSLVVLDGESHCVRERCLRLISTCLT